MTIELSKTEKEILKDIALKGEKTIYDIAVKDRIASRSTVSEALEKFQRLGLIEVKREEPFPKIKENIKRYYGLTFRGLVAALKIPDVKVHLIKNRDNMIVSWIEKCSKIDRILKLRQKMKIKASWKMLEDAMLKYVKQYPEDMTGFLRHYDLEFSDDLIIYGELVLRSATKLGSLGILNRTKRRQLEQLEKLAPEFAAYLIIPQLWGLEKEGVES